MAPRLSQTELSFIGKMQVALLSAFTIIYTTISQLFKWGNANGVGTKQIDKQSKPQREKERNYSPNGDIEPKVPVENDCFMENNRHQPQPKSLQCPGGSDSNTTTKKEETALKESTGSQSTTVYPYVYPSHGTKQNGGGNGGDSDPTKKTRPDENRGHYLGKGAVSLKTKVPHQESCGTSNGTASENHSEDEKLPENESSAELARNDLSDMASPSGTQQFDETSYKILHQFQDGLNVGADGFYKRNRNYKILRKIGKGGYGTVFKIEDVKSGEKFALKKVCCKYFNPHELEIWANLSQNKYVVTLLGAYSNGTYVHMFMELMDCTLQLIGENRKQLDITERKVAAIMKPVLEFLGFMHGKGYVYVDMKADNILVSHLAIKGSDFGLSECCARGSMRLQESDIRETGKVMRFLLLGISLYEEEVDTLNNCSSEIKTLLDRMLDPVKENRPTANQLINHPLFSDTPGSVLRDVLKDVLEDVQRILKNSPVLPL